jgi:transcriptional regulator with XRE-family HTH domain
MSLIVQVEQGQRDDIKLSTAAALADALGIPLDDLLGRQEPRKWGRER